MFGSYYRIKKYGTKVNVVTLLADLTAQDSQMKQNFANVTNEMSSMDLLVKQELDVAGVSTLQYPFYLAYGRQLWKATRVRMFSGQSMAQLNAVYVAKWVARGLSSAVLQDVAVNVYSISAPLAP
jgi:hypothetical protein